MKNQWRVIVGILLILVIVLFAVANNMTVPDQLWLHNDSIATDLSHYWFCFVRRIDFVAGFHKRNVPSKKRTKTIEKRALGLSLE